MTKTCQSCEQVKSLDDFCKRKSSKDGRAGTCKNRSKHNSFISDTEVA